MLAAKVNDQAASSVIACEVKLADSSLLYSSEGSTPVATFQFVRHRIVHADFSAHGAVGETTNSPEQAG